MNSTDFESQITTTKAQEIANASSGRGSASNTITAATQTIQIKQEGIRENQATNQTVVGNFENVSPPNNKQTIDSNSSTSQTSLKVFAPVISNDVTLPNTITKVPMVMVPVTDRRTTLAKPLLTLKSITTSQHTLDSLMERNSKDEQQARDLLVWNDGVGTLDGCDLRFKINQLGCLELLDSDNESENQIVSNKQGNAISTNKSQSSKNTNINNRFNPTKTTNGIADLITTNYTNERVQKKTKIDLEPAPIRQISPGSSLLRDGPNIRRPKSSSGSNFHSTTGKPQNNSLSLLKKIEQNQNSILLDKLVPKQRLDEIKTKVEQWTIEDVRRFVDSIPGCSGNGELFETQQICGKSLMYLDQRDLLDVINVKLGPAVKIYHAISLLK